MSDNDNEIIPWTLESFPKNRVIWVKPKSPNSLTDVDENRIPLMLPTKIGTKGVHLQLHTEREPSFVNYGRLLDKFEQANGEPCGTTKEELEKEVLEKF
tara:strand:+ start:247 stop:543 length:297 start_codon:yes stop_codon:yes gene_type:complete